MKALTVCWYLSAVDRHSSVMERPHLHWLLRGAAVLFLRNRRDLCFFLDLGLLLTTLLLPLLLFFQNAVLSTLETTRRRRDSVRYYLN